MANVLYVSFIRMTWLGGKLDENKALIWQNGKSSSYAQWAPNKPAKMVSSLKL